MHTESAQPLRTALRRFFPPGSRPRANPTPESKPTPPEFTQKNAETGGQGSKDMHHHEDLAHLLVGPGFRVIHVGVSRWAHLVPIAQESIESHALGWRRQRVERGHRRNSGKALRWGWRGGCTPGHAFCARAWVRFSTTITAVLCHVVPCISVK